MNCVKMNSNTLKELEKRENIKILKDNNIEKDTIYDFYIIIDENIKNGEIIKQDGIEKEYELSEEEKEKMIVHCLFEQSGVFKNEFIELGYKAIDYDIQNEFNETDFILDLFKEIDNAYNNKKSIFDSIKSDDLILAFFPCTRFESQIQLYFSGNAVGQKKWSDKKKIEYAMNLHEELHLFYKIFSELMLICMQREIPLIIENPCTEPHYLTKYFPIKSTITDKDRRVRGDYYKKPTQYWFINCKPKQNMVLEAYSIQSTKVIMDIHNKTERSLISKEYARRFIKEFIL